jgi:uncharacterized protein YciI
MKLKSSLIAIAGLALVAVLVAQTGQTSQSTSQSQSGNGTSSGSASSSGRAWSTGSASGGKNVSGGTSVNGRGNGNGSGSGSGSGFGLNAKPTHAIMYTLESSVESADDKQRAFQQHTKYLGEQQGKGKVLIHGPWRDLPGSMAIIVAQSDNEANEIAKNDPAVKSGALTFEVRAWLVQAPTTASSAK